MSGSMSGMWRRSCSEGNRPVPLKLVMTDNLGGCHRATSRLYRLRVLKPPIALAETCRSH
jgi:hypothetical protein